MIFITLLGYVFFSNGNSDELFLSQECWRKKNVKAVEFSGIVEKNFVDSMNHNLPAISLLNNGHSQTVHLYTEEAAAFLDTLKVNDSISKKANSLTYYISNKNSNYTVTLKLKCDN